MLKTTIRQPTLEVAGSLLVWFGYVSGLIFLIPESHRPEDVNVAVAEIEVVSFTIV